MREISVIIPVYNTPLNKLEKCIKSVLRLKIKCDIEIIVIDDGSKEYIKTFFKEKFIGDVIYIYKTNGGVSSARNMGLDVATGKFICFVDADDIVIDNAFENIKEFRGFQMILFDMNVIENNREVLWKALECKESIVDKKTILTELITSNRVNSPCAKLFSNECIKKNNIRFDEQLVTGEDLNFVMDFLKCTEKYYYAERIAYIYQRENSSRMTRIMRYPDIYYSNIRYLNDRLTSVIDNYKMERCRSYLIEDKINGAYNYLSDLMILHLFTVARRNRVHIDMERLNYTGVSMSLKTLMKYKLIIQKRWNLIHCMAYVRMLYLKIK